MNSLIALLIRQGLAACGGFFAANNITGNSTASIAVGLIMLAIPTVWSWIAKCLHLEDSSKYGFLPNSEILRTLIGSIVSQGITALSVYFATDANNPELLGVAIANAAASKAGMHQKLAFLGAKDALKLFALCSLLSTLCSCSSFTKQDAINYGERVGLFAGDAAIVLAQLQLANAQSALAMELSNPNADKRAIMLKQIGVSTAQQALKAASAAIAKQRAKLDAKQPRDVSPSADSADSEDSAPLPSTINQSPSTSDDLPACLRVVAIPLPASLREALQAGDYGTRVAAMR